MESLEALMGVLTGWEFEQVESGKVKARLADDEGSVDVTYCLPLPGVFLLDIDLSRTSLPVYLPDGAVTSINWCAQGRCEVDLGDGGSFVVGDETLCVSSATATTFSYPTGRYRGFEYVMDLARVDEKTWCALGALGMQRGEVRRMLMRETLTMRATGELRDAIAAIEAELGTAEPRCPRLALETLRLLMALSDADLDSSRIAGSYLQRGQRDMAQAVFRHIHDDPSRGADLKAMARGLGVSEASLRGYFTKVYGATPAAYARSLALRTAASRLEETDEPVGDIAIRSGYSNPSKFAAAFRREFAVSPLEWRRRRRTSGEK